MSKSATATRKVFSPKSQHMQWLGVYLVRTLVNRELSEDAHVLLGILGYITNQVYEGCISRVEQREVLETIMDFFDEYRHRLNVKTRSPLGRVIMVLNDLVSRLWSSRIETGMDGKRLSDYQIS